MEAPISNWGCLILVLTAHILTSPLVSAQAASDNTTVHVEPKLPKVGEDVTLFPGEIRKDTISCAWYRGENATLTYTEILIYYVQSHTIYFRGGYDKRQFIGKDCILHLQNVRMGDRAIYEIRKRRAAGTEKGEAFLEVSSSKQALSTFLSCRFLIWWYIWFSGC